MVKEALFTLGQSKPIIHNCGRGFSAQGGGAGRLREETKSPALGRIDSLSSCVSCYPNDDKEQKCPTWVKKPTFYPPIEPTTIWVDEFLSRDCFSVNVD